MTNYSKKKVTELLKSTGDMALKRRARKVIEFIDPKDNERILEAGCSWGFYLNILSKIRPGAKLFGVDIDDKALKIARKNLKSENVKILEVDLSKRLPFKDNFFDKIISSEVLEHVENDALVLKELKRVLKKDGTLVITVPNRNYPFLWDPVNKVREFLSLKPIKEGLFAGIWNDHERLYTRAQLTSLIQKAGLKAEKVEPMTWWCFPFNHNILYGGKLKVFPNFISRRLYRQIQKGDGWVRLAIGIMNVNDKLNDMFFFGDIGVGLIAKTSK